MFIDSVNGLDKLFESDILKGFIILVVGAAGTLKSGFVHSLLSNYLSDNQEFGLYATLEESEENHLRNMKSLGINKPDKLEIFDYKDIRKEWESEKIDMIKITKDIIDFYKKREDNFTIFALDSLNALHSLVNSKNPRNDSYNFFTMLKESGLTSFIIMETGDPRTYPEHFLVDGEIELGILETKTDVKRYMQIKKMRATKHSMKKHQFIVNEDGIWILGPLYETWSI
ncbi:MAG: ATPase domain-containing protein [Methanobacterium sp.]|jgi:KaiC/GvpD/RAD55 family RecA-like ATPase